MSDRQQQIAILSEAITRAAFAVRHGLQYEGDRDLYQVGGYPKALKWQDYLDLYERGGIAGQLVDAAAETTWRTPPEIIEPDTAEGETEFSRAWAALAKRLRVWSVLEEADKWSRVGRFSLIVIGTPDTDAALRNELVQVSSPDDILYLSTYRENQIQIEDWDTDPQSERFGLPLTYSIDFSGDVEGFRPQSRAPRLVVHWSRVIHVADSPPGKVFGRPVLQRPWNLLHDLDKVTTSTAEAYWQRVAGLLHAQFPKEVMPSEEELQALEEDMQAVFHDLRRFLIGNFDVKRVAESEPNPGPAADLYMTLIAASATPPMPKRMLFGSETGERASTEDQKTWLGAIESRVVQVAEPNILRPLIDRLIQVRALPRPGEYEVVWPTLYSEPETVKAEANERRAKAIAALTPIGGDPSVLYEVDEERNIWPIPRTADEASPFEGTVPEPVDVGDEPPAMEEAA